MRKPVPFMPRNAMTHVKIDYCLPLEEIAPLLVRLTTEAAEGEYQVPKEVEIELNIAKEQNAIDAGVLQLGEPSNYACPECHGVLLQMKEGTLFRFRCHTGHAYSVESLLSDITEKMDDALWNSIRAPSKRASCSCDIWLNISITAKMAHPQNPFSNALTMRNDEPI